MSWRLRTEHTTGYRYDQPVSRSYNEARITPQTGSHQVTLEATIETAPRATLHRYWDYWGTQVTAFDLHTLHEELSVTGRSVVETSPAPALPEHVPSWSDYAGDELSDRFVELLTPTTYTPAQEELVAAALELKAAHAPADFVPAASEWVRSALEYRQGSTGVHTSAVEAWEAGSGVCQDFAHLYLVLLRAAGLPSRYVSGYLHPRRDAAIGEPVTGESHAWVDVWLGDWWGFDPTNAIPAGEAHVIVAQGRDYRDVPPLHGVYSGAPSASLGVTVTVTRLQ